MFTLALALGMTVAELGDRMSSRELAEWQAFYALEPFGDVRADFRTGLLASMLANMVRSKGHKPAKITDFMIHRDAKPAAKPGQAAGAPAPLEARASQLEMIDALKALGGKE